jgi:hypothetical protein
MRDAESASLLDMLDVMNRRMENLLVAVSSAFPETAQSMRKFRALVLTLAASEDSAGRKGVYSAMFTSAVRGWIHEVNGTKDCLAEAMEALGRARKEAALFADEGKLSTSAQPATRYALRPRDGFKPAGHSGPTAAGHSYGTAMANRRFPDGGDMRPVLGRFLAGHYRGRRLDVGVCWACDFVGVPPTGDGHSLRHCSQDTLDRAVAKMRVSAGASGNGGR